MDDRMDFLKYDDSKRYFKYRDKIYTGIKTNNKEIIIHIFNINNSFALVIDENDTNFIINQYYKIDFNKILMVNNIKEFINSDFKLSISKKINSFIKDIIHNRKINKKDVMILKLNNCDIKLINNDLQITVLETIFVKN